MKREAYDEHLEKLEVELAAMARWAKVTGNRVLVLFEGRDTAGKGGAIHAISATLNPRQVRVVALSKPSDVEKGQWYFQRYIAHLPTAGEIVLFDRSWYNRARLRTARCLASEGQVEAFLKAVPRFEKMLTDDGIILVKYWLSCDQKEQEERFAERLADPLKRWKLSPIDVAARAHYEDYTEAREAMFAASHTDNAPWTVVDFNDQKLGRLTLIRDLLDRLPDLKVPDEQIDWPPLGHEPIDETYGQIKPIPRFGQDD